MWTRFVIVALKHFRTITNTTEQMNHSHLATPGSGGAGRLSVFYPENAWLDYVALRKMTAYHNKSLHIGIFISGVGRRRVTHGWLKRIGCPSKKCVIWEQL